MPETVRVPVPGGVCDVCHGWRRVAVLRFRFLPFFRVMPCPRCGVMVLDEAAGTVEWEAAGVRTFEPRVSYDGGWWAEVWHPGAQRARWRRFCSTRRGARWKAARMARKLARLDRRNLLSDSAAARRAEDLEARR